MVVGCWYRTRTVWMGIRKTFGKQQLTQQSEGVTLKTMKHKSKETGGNVIMNKKMAIVRTEYVMLPWFGAIC